jgi:DNA primase
MPEGYDPDDLIKERGRDSMQNLVDDAISIGDLLWRRETEGLSFDNPEARAALDKKLDQALSTVRDRQLKYHYQQHFKDLKWSAFIKKSGRKPSGFQNNATTGNAVKGSFIANSDTKNFIALKETVILAILIKYPSLIEPHKEKLTTMGWASKEHISFLDEIINMGYLGSEKIMENLENKFDDKVLGKLFKQSHVNIIPCLGTKNDPQQAEAILFDEINKLEMQRGLEAELEELVNSSDEELDETAFWRLGQATQAKFSTKKSGKDDLINFETAPNGVKLDKEEKSQFDALLEEISQDTFNKSKNREN